MFNKFDKWLDSLPDWTLAAMLIGMSLIVSYTILGGLQ